ncbi:MAG TPA: hypothetical protein VGN57_07445 [Pirellulaceae bacterium]|jgi:hypothetical protein|nr:hypothetical protein [Pirellulaceae bacterium]
MEIVCPECDRPFAASDMNATKDVAVCPECDEAFSVSGLAADQKELVEEFDLGRLPAGVAFEQTRLGWRLTSTARSSDGFFLVPFALFWYGLGLPSLYAYVTSGEYDWNQNVGVLLFCMAALVVMYLALLTTIGRLAVSVERGEGNVVVGVGFIRWTRRFDWNTVRKVQEEPVAPGHDTFAIVLIGQQSLRFGSMLTDERRRFLVQALRKLLATRDA